MPVGSYSQISEKTAQRYIKDKSCVACINFGSHPVTAMHICKTGKKTIFVDEGCCYFGLDKVWASRAINNFDKLEDIK